MARCDCFGRAFTSVNRLVQRDVSAEWLRSLRSAPAVGAQGFRPANKRKGRRFLSRRPLIPIPPILYCVTTFSPQSQCRRMTS